MKTLEEFKYALKDTIQTIASLEEEYVPIGKEEQEENLLVNWERIESIIEDHNEAGLLRLLYSALQQLDSETPEATFIVLSETIQTLQKKCIILENAAHQLIMTKLFNPLEISSETDLKTLEEKIQSLLPSPKIITPPNETTDLLTRASLKITVDTDTMTFDENQFHKTLPTPIQRQNSGSFSIFASPTDRSNPGVIRDQPINLPPTASSSPRGTRHHPIHPINSVYFLNYVIEHMMNNLISLANTLIEENIQEDSEHNSTHSMRL